MSYNINDAIKQAEKDYGLGKGEYFKPKDGPNKIRILSHLDPYQSEFKGKVNFKFVCWILDRQDGVVKPYFMPVTIANAIGAFQDDPEYAFDDMPMPYDININAKGAGTIDVEYQVTAGRSNTPLTDAEKKALDERMSIGEFVTKLREKNAQEGKSEPTDSRDPIAQTLGINPTEDADVDAINDQLHSAAQPSKLAQVVGQKTGGKFGAPVQ